MIRTVMADRDRLDALFFDCAQMGIRVPISVFLMLP